MIKIPKYIIIVLLLTYHWAHAGNTEVTEQYIRQYAQIAIDEMNRVGIPASIKMAQAILESNSGRSTLSRQSNNHFGIKCGKNWNGAEVYREDDDYHNGLLIRSCFRAYDDPAESFYAHSDFLANPYSKRYKFLFDLDPHDYRAWAKGLKKAGYATDPKYPTKLIGIIETYNLNDLDVGFYPHDELVATVIEPSQNADDEIINGQIINKPSEESDHETRLNNVHAKRVDKVYKSTASINFGKGSYTIRSGDTMAAIADRYNIPLKTLYVQNRMPFGSEPKDGEKLALDHYIHFKHTPAYWTPEDLDKKEGKENYLWSETITLAMK